MTSRFFSKKSLLICGFFISCIIGWCIQPLCAMAVVTQLVSITSQTLQQIALFVGTAFCCAKHYQKDSLIGQLLAQNSHAESVQVSHIKEDSPVNLVASIESARHEIAVKQQDITAAYALPQIKVFERIKNSTSDAGIYASLHKLRQEPSRVVQEWM